MIQLLQISLPKVESFTSVNAVLSYIIIAGVYIAWETVKEKNKVIREKENRIDELSDKIVKIHEEHKQDLIDFTSMENSNMIEMAKTINKFTVLFEQLKLIADEIRRNNKQ